MSDILSSTQGGGASGLVPPQALDAERSVLAAMLLDQESIGKAVEMIDETAFYRVSHQKIFAALVALYSRNEPADLITVSEELRKRGDFEAVGGAAALAQLMEFATTSANIENHIRIVHSKAVLRMLIKATNEIQQQAYAGQEETALLLDRAEASIFQITDQRIRAGFSSIRELLKPTFDSIQKLFERKVQVTGVPTGFDDLDKLTAGWQPGDLVIVAGRPSMGKCVRWDTPVVDPRTGERVLIEEAIRRRMPCVLGIDERGRVRSTPVSHWIDSGVQPCWRVTTRTGRSIEVTGHHPFLTVEGWRPLHDLTVGDHVAIPRRIPAFGRVRESYDRVRLLAYFIAEGGLTHGVPCFTTADPMLRRDFEYCLETAFPTAQMAPHPDGITWRISRKPEHRAPAARGILANPVSRWLDEMGLFGLKSEAKAFPSAIWTWDPSRLSVFLNVLFTCDGTIYDMNGYPRIEFTVASKRLAEDVHHALLRFGVMSKLWRKTEKSWRVEITEPSSVARYQEAIGWFNEKARRFPPEAFDASIPTRHACAGGAPPRTWTKVRAAAELAGMPVSYVARLAGDRTEGGYNAHTNRAIRRERLERFAFVLEDPELKRIASPDLYWDEIVEIRPTGSHQVYDLTVPDGHNFVAADLLVHNTSVAMNMAENAAVRFGIPVAVFSLEMSKEQLALRMLCSQSEVALHKLRTGYLSNEDWPRLTTGAGLLTQAPVYIDDSPAQSVLEVRAKCRRLKAENKLGLVVIDYLQLMRSSTPAENRVQEISQISRGLKALAKELAVPVIALSQLSRAVEQRGGSGRPQLSDLRESGCLTADTRILRADTGAETTMGQLIESGEQDIPVWTLDADYRMVRGVMTHVFASGTKETFELKLASGRSVKASPNHPFLTLDGWRRLDELKVGGRIGVPRVVPSPATARAWHESEVVMLAHLLGDGCFASHQPIHYTSGDPANIEAVEQAASHWGIRPRRIRQKNWWHVYLPASEKLTHGKRNPIAAWLDQYGLYGLRSYQKFVPDEVFALSQDQLAMFLRHLWATDGCVHVGPGQVRIYYATTSPAFAEGVRQLLLRFGVSSRLKVSQKAEYRPSYQVHVTGKSNQLGFLRQIGVHGARGMQVERAIEQLADLRENTNVDTIPAEVWNRVRTLMPELGVTARALAAGLGTAYCGSTLYKHAPSRGRMSAVAQVLGAPELERLASSDLFWDAITEIIPLGLQPVFDATVPGTHNFVANGIVVHNSIEQDADVVAFVYREVVYKPDTPEPGKAQLIIAKQRNGPIDDVNLTFLRECTKFVPYSPMMPGETDPGF